MSQWPGSISAITVFADDLPTARRFYTEVFGLPVVFEDEESTVFRFDNTLVNLLATNAAAEVIAPAMAARPGDGARVQLTITVDDVDVMCAELARRGVELLNWPVDRPWGIRTASFRDPAGLIWEIAH